MYDNAMSNNEELNMNLKNGQCDSSSLGRVSMLLDACCCSATAVLLGQGPRGQG